MLALFAAQQAAAVTGLAGGHVPAIGAGTLDGFAVGMLLSGGVFLLVTAHGQGSRRLGRAAAVQAATEPGSLAVSQPGGQELGDYPLPAPVSALALAMKSSSAIDERLLALGHLDAAETAEPEFPALPALPDERPLPAARGEEEPGSAAERAIGHRPGGYQSRHRQSGPEDSRPWPGPDGRRHAPRHAAPASSTLARRMAALVPVRMAVPSHRAV